MKVLLNSIVIGGKWKIKKQLFQNDHKLFLAAYDQTNPNNQSTLLLMNYDETTQQHLAKMICHIKKDVKQNRNSKLLVPDKPIMEILNKTKVLVMVLQEKPISLHWLISTKMYEFSPIEIIQAAISGIGSLSELHALNVVHSRINPKTCYFFNRSRKLLMRKATKVQISTFFAVCLVDVEKFTTKTPSPQNRINQMLYEPCSKALGLKPGFKDDLQSFLYVLIKMVTDNVIFSNDRYHKQWRCDENVRKWKLSNLYLQLLKKLPPHFSFLTQLYLQIQEMSTNEKIDYSGILKKLWKEKQKLLSRQVTLPNDIRQFEERNKNEAQLQLDEGDSLDSIFEEDIKIEIRTEERKGFRRIQFEEQ